MIFSSIFLHAVTFSHVLHLDVLKSQIGLKLKVKTEISLCMAIMQNNHCHLYIHSTTVLCDIQYCNNESTEVQTLGVCLGIDRSICLGSRDAMSLCLM